MVGWGKCIFELGEKALIQDVFEGFSGA